MMVGATQMMEIVAGAVAGALACTWSGGMQNSLLLRNIVVFFAAKIAGDSAKAALGKRHTYYLEDLLNDCILYCILAAISAAAIWLAGRYLGASVEPLFPGVGAHIVLTLIPGRERGAGTGGGFGAAVRRH